ncbi:DUF6178 family protein [Stigmatella sp. ncwal1]|uniref:DUF6178 family protein n=1 Tax=Stigmatella ashevillensis TaxID=2995309 RepID=A0ABT5D5Q4_9BACT|nr:DUF6178 family protein [Stigmatella ashevillena]MDC0708399.1 DUF6178 family protein [Stigmatella ashevillena]
MPENNQGNGKDAQLALRELRRQLTQLPPRKRLDALIESPEAQALVRSLPAELLFITLQEIGLADATDLVQLASPAQFRAFVDLGAWKRDRIDSHGVLTWLRAARGDEPEEFLRKLHGMDLEILEYLLREFTAVYDLEEDPDVHPPGVTMETPEGRYLVEFKVEGAEQAALRMILNDLIAENPFEAVRLLEATRWEIPSELEEAAYRFRTARLQDLGFPTLDEAASLFSRVDTGTAPARSGQAALVPAQGRVDYLDAAVRGLSELERENLEDELRGVANAALVAELADPGDLEAVRSVGEMVRDYLSLGLEHLSGAEPALAPDLVRDTPLRRIFQVGFSLTLALKFRADRLAKRAEARVDDTLMVFPEEAAALKALRLKRPRRALRVPGAEPVPFRSLREIAASEALLGRAEAQVALFQGLLGDASAAHQVVARFGVPLEVLGVDRLFVSAVAMAVLEGQVNPRPVPGGRTVELCERLFEGTPQAPVVRPSAEQRALATLEPQVEAEARPELHRLVRVSLERLREEIAAPYLQEGRLDPALSVVLPMEGNPTA